MKPGDENTETGALDWAEQVNQQLGKKTHRGHSRHSAWLVDARCVALLRTRLKDLRKLMRCLFQAFVPRILDGQFDGGCTALFFVATSSG